MKTLLTVFTIMGITLNLHGQDKFTTYINSYAQKEFEISVAFDEKNREKFTLYIDAYSLEKVHDKGGFKVEEKELDGFLKAIQEAKAKYIEWVQTAKQNNVTDVTKNMEIKCKAGGYFLYGREWEFQFMIKPVFKFMVMKSGNELKYILSVHTGQLTSSSNQYMKVDGFLLLFENTEEVDAFTSELTFEKIKAFRDKPKSQDLFK